MKTLPGAEHPAQHPTLSLYGLASGLCLGFCLFARSLGLTELSRAQLPFLRADQLSSCKLLRVEVNC